MKTLGLFLVAYLTLLTLNVSAQTNLPPEQSSVPSAKKPVLSEQMLEELYSAGEQGLQGQRLLFKYLDQWMESDSIEREYERVASRFDDAIFACFKVAARNGHKDAAAKLAKLDSDSRMKHFTPDRNNTNAWVDKEKTLDELYSAGRHSFDGRHFLRIELEHLVGSDYTKKVYSDIVPQFDTAIFTCLDIAARNGHALAAVYLAKLISDSHLKQEHSQRAEELLKQAMDEMVKQVEKKPSLALDAGYAYLYQFTPKDIQKAEQCFKIGADKNNPSCVWYLGNIAKKQGKSEQAFQYYLRAAQLGQGMAMFEVGKCFEKGIGTVADKSKAIEWYKRCINSRYAASHDAKVRLKMLEND